MPTKREKTVHLNRRTTAIGYDIFADPADMRTLPVHIDNVQKRLDHTFEMAIADAGYGSEENANRLIRRFISKGANIARYSEQYIKYIEQWMNNYPRKLLGYKTANQCYWYIA